MLHNKIRELMKVQGIGNKELAEKSGVPIGTLNKILNGISISPKYSTVEAIAKALDCTTDDLADSTEESPDSIANMTETEIDAAIEKEGIELVELINQLPQKKMKAIIEFLKVMSSDE